MTEAWTGRKYKAISGDIIEILSEPFKAKDGRKWVGFENSYIVGVSPLEGCFPDERRIIEPRYAVGQEVTDEFTTYRIIGVSSEPDEEGDFAYFGKLVGRGSSSGIHTLFQSQIAPGVAE